MLLISTYRVVSRRVSLNSIIISVHFNIFVSSLDDNRKTKVEGSDNCSYVRDLGWTSTSLLSAGSVMKGLTNELKLSTVTWYSLKESLGNRPVERYV